MPLWQIAAWNEGGDSMKARREHVMSPARSRGESLDVELLSGPRLDESSPGTCDAREASPARSRVDRVEERWTPGRSPKPSLPRPMRPSRERLGRVGPRLKPGALRVLDVSLASNSRPPYPRRTPAARPIAATQGMEAESDGAVPGAAAIGRPESPERASSPDARPAVSQTRPSVRLPLTFPTVRCITTRVVLQVDLSYPGPGPSRLIMRRSQYPIVSLRLGPHVLARLDRVLIAENRWRCRGDRTEAITIALIEWMERQERNARRRGCGA